MKGKEIRPVGNFIMDNCDESSMPPLETPMGTYYHYVTVCTLMNKYAKQIAKESLECAAESHLQVEPEYTRRDTIESEDNIPI